MFALENTVGPSIPEAEVYRWNFTFVIAHAKAIERSGRAHHFVWRGFIVAHVAESRTSMTPDVASVSLSWKLRRSPPMPANKMNFDKLWSMLMSSMPMRFVDSVSPLSHNIILSFCESLVFFALEISVSH